MLTEERLAQIADLCRLSRLRMNVERPFHLLSACEDLLDEIERLRPVQGLLWEARR